MGKVALGLIDGQRGFMPASEGVRLGLPGFGELEVPDGDKIIEPVNELMRLWGNNGLAIFTTQDWHPKKTGHFSKDPNFRTTWPEHCVANTPGAQLHPDFNIPSYAKKFVKGTENHIEGEYDTSYSGVNGYELDGGQTLPEWLREIEADEVYLAGLATDYCVKETALGIKEKLGIEVYVISDAVKAVAPETNVSAIEELEAAGVKLVTHWQSFPLAH